MSLFARLSGRVSGRDGRAWAGSVEDLLFDGETVERRVELGGDDRVVVTSHRLLAFTPGSGGENYRGVDLPNVADVRAGHEGERNLLGIGGRTAVYGAVLLAVGVFVDFGAFVPTDAFQQTGVSGQLGMGGLLAMLQQFLGVIARIDEFARLIGAVLVLFAVFVFGVYLLTRDRVLVVDVAGDDGDIRVPAEDDALDAAVADLEVVLFGSDASVDAGGAETVGVEAAETSAGVGSAPDGDSDPLAPKSGAVRSDGITGGAESTASGSDESVSAEVDRAVRETSGTDFSETVDEVVGEAGDDADSEGDGADTEDGAADATGDADALGTDTEADAEDGNGDGSAFGFDS
ncbi:hypothetical protein ACFQMA_10125 [Halosimplex aquaticum]|uniref:NfeD-like C-terminal, partner-binding n=1 Tax=Halosimplex aquaticum TaxID=3026162 RepID=A0ABD5Y3B5_9EURY|nr:hypothetical protein [Halosimplex aquaticum]